MRILHVITSLNTGGAEHLMVDLLPRLRDRGNEVELCLFNGAQTSFYKQLEEEGIKIHSFNESLRYYNPLHLWRLRRLMKGFDLVHTHNTAPQLFAAIAKRGGIKLVTTEHNTTNRRRSIKCLRWVDKWMYSRYEKVICISDKAESNLRDYLKDEDKKILTIYNGVNVDRFVQASPCVELKESFADKKIVVMVSAFRPQKDQKTLIRAFEHLPEDYALLLVGDGESLEEVKSFAHQCAFRDRIHFLGMRTDIPSVLKTSDVVVMSSHYEGLSLSSIEGMACGKPFVASDVDGLREIVKGRGILFPEGDDASLASIIQQLCTDKDYAQEIAKKCQERAKQYDIVKMVDGYDEAYRLLMENNN